MSHLNRKSDVKNHLSVRHHKANHVYPPLSQGDAQVIAPVEPGAIKTDPLDVAEDPIEEHSSSNASVSSNDSLTSSSRPQTPAPPRSVRE